MPTGLGQIDRIPHKIEPRDPSVVGSERLAQGVIRHLRRDLIILACRERHIIERQAAPAEKRRHDDLEGHRRTMIHMRLLPRDAFARNGTGNQTVRTAMGSEEIIAGLVEIEAHRTPKGLGDLLLTAWWSLGDAVWIGEIRAAAIPADDPEALRPMLGHHDLEMADATAHLGDIFSMAFEKGRNVEANRDQFSLANSVQTAAGGRSQRAFDKPARPCTSAPKYATAPARRQAALNRSQRWCRSALITRALIGLIACQITSPWSGACLAQFVL